MWFPDAEVEGRGRGGGRPVALGATKEDDFLTGFLRGTGDGVRAAGDGESDWWASNSSGDSADWSAAAQEFPVSLRSEKCAPELTKSSVVQAVDVKLVV